MVLTVAVPRSIIFAGHTLLIIELYCENVKTMGIVSKA